jgi:hypothetical protein
MASVPFSYECSTAAGFLPDPARPQRVGYLTQLTIDTIDHPKDMRVFFPTFNQPIAFKGLGTVTPPATPEAPGRLNVVGVMERFEWDGGVGNPLHLDFVVSQNNARQIKATQESTLPATKINAVAWWIADYDVETKRWYEQSFPVTAVSGLVSTGKDNPELNVDLTGVQPEPGIDVQVYRVSISVTPAPNSQGTLHFATSPTVNLTKSWGLVVGNLPPYGSGTM